MARTNSPSHQDLAAELTAAGVTLPALPVESDILAVYGSLGSATVFVHLDEDEAEDSAEPSSKENFKAALLEVP